MLDRSHAGFLDRHAGEFLGIGRVERGQFQLTIHLYPREP